jgi:creatinine amidohydrolase
LVANEFREVLIVSHHGDRAHNEMVRDVLTSLHAQGRTNARWLYTPFRWRMFERIGQTGREPIWVRWEHTPELEAFKLTGVLGVHADEYETAAMVRYFPDTVDYDALDAAPPTRLTPSDLQRWRAGGESAPPYTRWVLRRAPPNRSRSLEAFRHHRQNYGQGNCRRRVTRDASNS